VLCEAPQGENEGFDLAGGASSGCFNYRFVLEEEFSWVGVSVVLWEDGQVEAWWPLELFEFHRKRSDETSSVLPMLLLHHFVFTLFFVGVHDGSWARPYRLRCVRRRRWLWARGLILL